MTRSFQILTKIITKLNEQNSAEMKRHLDIDYSKLSVFSNSLFWTFYDTRIVRICLPHHEKRKTCFSLVFIIYLQWHVSLSVTSFRNEKSRNSFFASTKIDSLRNNRFLRYFFPIKMMPLSQHENNRYSSILHLH